jgi:SAM-dependent methyltransferase
VSEKPSSASEKVAAFWDQRHRIGEADAQDNYLNHPLITAYISLRAFGNITPHLEVVVAEIRAKTQPGARIYSPGCGQALKEVALARLLPDRHFVAGDIAVGPLERGRAAAAAAGVTNLTLVQHDFNDLRLEKRSFDAVCGMGAFHHVENLEGFWASCREALRPGGVIMGQEYVGPNRLQWTDDQVREGTRVLDEIVPDAHKVHHRTVARPDLDEMMRLDPSEAVRSRDILPTLEAAGFKLFGYASGGGALLQPVLMYQVHTFDPRDWQHNLTLARLFLEEDRLMESGMLGDDFCQFVTVPL